MRTYLFLAGCFLLLTACGALAEAQPPVLPEAADLDRVAIAFGGLELTAADRGFIAQLLESLGQSVQENTGTASIRDVPEGKPGLVRIDFGFRSGGINTVFLYREGERLLLEQPYQGVWELDRALEDRLRTQVALELARSQTTKQE